jgi:thiamine pyrophosphokinase
METPQSTNLAVVAADAPSTDLQFYAGLMHEADLRVAADGGARHFLQIGILPHIAIGDFDSLPAAMLEQLAQQGVRIERHPVHKDETDLELALLHAIHNGARRIVVLAALGGRPDQHLANLQLLTHPALASADVRMRHRDWEVFAIHDTATIEGEPGQTVSLLPMTEQVEGIVTHGLYYPLEHEALRLGPARGVSNVLTERRATVTIRSGILLVMHQLSLAAGTR